MTDPTVLLWDVDTQVDFVLPHGRLAVPGADAVLPQMAALVRWARAQGVVHVASVDDHEIGDPEIALEGADFTDTYPPHCLRGTVGAGKVAETAQEDPLPLGAIVHPPGAVRRLLEGRREILLLKKSFDVFTNPNAEKVLDVIAPDRVLVFGVATDVCNDAAVRGLRRRGYAVTVVEDAQRGLDEARTAAALEAWRGLGVELTTVERVVGGG